MGVRNALAAVAGRMEDVIRRPDRVLEGISEGPGAGRRLTSLLLVVVATSLPFGMATGAYVGGRQVWITGLKLPALLLSTLALCAPALVLAAPVLGGRLAPRRALGIALLSVAATSVCLGSLSPVVLVFSRTLRLWNHTHYVFLVLLLTLATSLAGAVSVGYLWRALGRSGVRERRLRIVVAWLLLYQFVGAQMAWILRPFVGSSSDTIRFEGNIYEALPMLVRAFFRGLL